ncbi:MAG: glutamate dehydrogenase, partial [Bdellovibrionales bacterium]|nr:glutamate dehydrogenase [Bdellovibrionales bacterium]
SLQDKRIFDSTLAIQGFGKVGMHAAIEGHALGAKIVAVSDVSGGLYNPRGLNLADLVRYVKEKKVITGFPDADPISNEDLLELDVDVLSPCALDGVIHENNADKIKARIIVEGANGPTTSEATNILYQKGKIVVPDILANGGGVVVSYFEWVQDIMWLFWTEEEVRTKLREIMYRSFDKVWKFAADNKKNLRTSAMATSLMRLEKAMLLRGQAW